MRKINLQTRISYKKKSDFVGVFFGENFKIDLKEKNNFWTKSFVCYIGKGYKSVAHNWHPAIFNK